jgi:Leucine-rich repeat (LRR) protein
MFLSLFCLWLDNNDVNGPIPTSIGLLKGLASLSIGNASLTGTIPSQIGHLTELKRVCLYDNDLEGTLLIVAMTQLNQIEFLEIHDNPLLNGTMASQLCEYISNSESNSD